MNVPRPKPQSAKKVTLKIPTELYDNLSSFIAGTGFRSVTEFAIYVLRDAVASTKSPRESSGRSQKKMQSLQERLRALGYLD